MPYQKFDKTEHDANVEFSENSLANKLCNIKKPAVLPLGEGSFEKISELWENFILPRLPKKATVLKWHDVLMKYINMPDAVFSVRGYNSEPHKDQYDKLRRGWLTHTDKQYSFFYTDNFHAAYYLKMACDDYVPSAEELLTDFKKRIFPARFGRDTEQERQLMALPKGKDPGFQNAGYLIAHVFDVGKAYFEGGQSLSLKRDILDVYFPRGERDDWKQDQDEFGEFYLRQLHVGQEARKYMVASFLRFVHPFNYFLMPKRTVCSNDISGNSELLNFAKYKLRELYGSPYDDFLELIMPEGPIPNVLQDAALIDYRYGNMCERKSNLAKEEKITRNETRSQTLSSSYSSLKVGKIAQTELRRKLQGIALEEAEKFTDIQYTQQFINLSFPLLATERKKDANGIHRYYANCIYIQGNKFYITSQWYEWQRASLLKWLDTH